MKQSGFGPVRIVIILKKLTGVKEMYKLLSIQPGFNNTVFYFIGNDSTYCQAWPVECYTSLEKAEQRIKEANNAVNH